MVDTKMSVAVYIPFKEALVECKQKAGSIRALGHNVVLVDAKAFNPADAENVQWVVTSEPRIIEAWEKVPGVKIEPLELTVERPAPKKAKRKPKKKDTGLLMQSVREAQSQKVEIERGGDDA
jgi:hypothetical protein